MNERNQKIIITPEMSYEEVYRKIKNVLPFHRYEAEYYKDYVMNTRNIDRGTARIILTLAHEVYLKTDEDISFDRIITSICDNLENHQIELEELCIMNKHDILGAVMNDNFINYSRNINADVQSITLDRLLSDLNESGKNVIYKLSPSEATQFVKLWVDGHNSLAEVRIVSENVAIDNRCGECFTEEFDTEKMALKWLDSDMSYEEIGAFFERIHEEEEKEKDRISYYENEYVEELEEEDFELE